MKKSKCPKCESKNLSDGKNDYLYDPFRGIEVPIQFCNDCHEEWFVIVEKQEQEKGR